MFFNDTVLKKILYSLIAVFIVAIIAVLSIYLWYSNQTNNDELYSVEIEEKFDDIKEASFSEDKNINTTIVNTLNENVVEINKVDNNTEPIITNNSKTEKKNDNQNIVKKELKFEAPVNGEIIKDFANDTLVFSKTLDEWTTHLGIDIKGDKTSIVKSAEDGKVESIKNDPRYGLTIIIAHQDGFKTVYSNLLTTEFVKEGDNVNKGDTIGTIGDTASFEVLDEPHLHFEIYKDEQVVNPTIYLK